MMIRIQPRILVCDKINSRCLGRFGVNKRIPHVEGRFGTYPKKAEDFKNALRMRLGMVDIQR
jgi:hypothetical protein